MAVRPDIGFRFYSDTEALDRIREHRMEVKVSPFARIILGLRDKRI